MALVNHKARRLGVGVSFADRHRLHLRNGFNASSHSRGRNLPIGNLRHAGRPVRRIRLQHSLDQRANPRVDATEIRDPLALFDELEMAAAHVEFLPGQE